MPLKPRNLVPEEVRAEHVKLSWDPPLDDGGTPITNYLVRYMDIDSGEWVTACTVRYIHLPCLIFFSVSTRLQPRGSIFQNEFLGEVQLKKILKKLTF